VRQGLLLALELSFLGRRALRRFIYQIGTAVPAIAHVR
jgi:hypothetical protein